MDVEYHVAGHKFYYCFRVGGSVVKKLGNLGSSFCCGGRLMTGDVIESREHGVINGSCIVEEGSNNLLDTQNIICAEDGKLYFIVCILNSSSVGRRRPGEGRVLTPAIPKMLEFVEGLADIAWHGEVNDAILVVPFQCDANIFGARPVLIDCVPVFEGINEEDGIFFLGVFDTKVINNKTEPNVPSLVLPEAWGETSWGKIVLGQMVFEEFIGKFSSLGKAVHAFLDLDIDVSISMDHGVEVVLLAYFFWDQIKLHSHVLRIFEWGLEIHVGNVEGEEFCSRC